MTTHEVTVRPRYWSVGKLLFWLIAVAGLVVVLMRLGLGIRAVSNMDNTFAWAYWNGVKLTAVALGAGAFTVCGAVHIFNLKQFKPLVRPAILVGLLGYLTFIFILIMDLGRPERIWHMIIYWNHSSVLFEVGICVMLYTTVLVLEFAPVVFERLGWERAIHRLHKIHLPLIILGVVLSTLHQSSLGSLFMVMSGKVHPLWHSNMLPLFYFNSAIAAGLSMVLVVASLNAALYKQPLRLPLLASLAKALPWVLGLYLTLKFGELYLTGDLHYLMTGDTYSQLFWGEMIGGAALPMILLAIPAVRNRRAGIVVAGGLVLLATLLNRFDVGLVGWMRPAGAFYFPSLPEIIMGVGIPVLAMLVYDLVARYLPLFADEGQSHS